MYEAQLRTKAQFIIAQSQMALYENIARSLAAAFDIESIYDADLAAEADDYLLEIGMAHKEIDALKANLSMDIQ